jgi:nitrite reductase/ring-hydroxylating ferredoxin subunit
MGEGKIYTVNAAAQAKGAPLEGEICLGYDLKCTWLFALFDVCDGKASIS